MNVREGVAAALKQSRTVQTRAWSLSSGEYVIDPLVSGHLFKLVGGSAVISDGTTNSEFPLADGESIYIPGHFESPYAISGTGTLHIIWHTPETPSLQ